MAGIGPISSQEIDRQRLKSTNYEQAKSWAVKAHLEKHYRYDAEELRNLQILETKRNAKEEIIYIAVADERDIKDIYSRKAECRSDDTIVRSFIPPQYWDRFAALNRICTQRRTQDALLKTQIRFGTRDLIVLTKEKGSQEPYVVTDADSFAEEERLPEVDMRIKWRFQEDRPQRRRVASPSVSPHPASRQRQQERPTNPQITRQISQLSQQEEINLKNRKKQRTTQNEEQSGLPAVQNMNITQ